MFNYMKRKWRFLLIVSILVALNKEVSGISGMLRGGFPPSPIFVREYFIKF